MNISFYQSEGGGITLFTAPNGHLFLKTDRKGVFLVNNPLSTISTDIHTMEVSLNDTPEQVFAKIDQFYLNLKQVVI
jgi:hypothetical protein